MFEMINYYSGSYTNIADNYVIICEEEIPVSNQFKESPLYGLFCVVKNIIQRGEPSEASVFLKKKFDISHVTGKYHLISDVPSFWDETIKGDSIHSDYPAETFFNKILPEYLGEYSFVRNLIIPEVDFDIILGHESAFSGQMVDFFVPQLSLVIEIDGIQHNQSMQRRQDSERDDELQRHGIEVLRIRTDEIKNRKTSLKKKLDYLLNKVNDNDMIRQYKECLNQDYPLSLVRMETAHRFQLLLLLCLMEKRLLLDSSEWKVAILDSDVPSSDELLLTAYEDLKLWITTIAKLLKLAIQFPQLTVVHQKNEADLCIDFSLFKRYDDTCKPNSNTVIVRTDYFPNKNYYCVEHSETLRYQLSLAEPSDDKKQLEWLLKNIFGFERFQEGQLQIIANVLEGKDTVGILPTGAGKSLCYQFVALLQPGVSIVIDPILSLMQDQKRVMRKMNITRNEMVSSIQTGSERGRALNSFEVGKYQILWISPERFQNAEFRKSLTEINRNLNFCHAVIDEVHCLSEWGHDFRVSYLALVRTIREYCPASILLGLTATASEFVLQDIKAEFGGEQPLDITNIKSLPSMDRPELIFERIPVADQTERIQKIKELLKSKIDGDHLEAGLLFCPTVRNGGTSCSAMSQVLSSEFGGKYRLFHGQMNQREKVKNQDDFMLGLFPMMICTKAFGMGIDKQDLRFTIHNSLPSSVESFYQEAGRAGRDRKKAICYILYNVDNNVRDAVNRISNSGNLLDLPQYYGNRAISQSDLSTPLYFLSSDHMNEIEERNYIVNVLKWINNNNKIQFDSSQDGKSYDKQTIEMALYKLSLLGFVLNWTVHYDNLSKGTIFVEKASSDQLSEKHVLDRFLKYVQKYDIEFSLDDNTNREYLELLNQQNYKYVNIIQMLIRWTNNNILYQRIQCTKTIMDWCSKDVDDESFRRNLEGYFRFSEETFILEYIAYHPMEWKRWFDCLYQLNDEKTRRVRVLSREQAQETYASLQRFLESYQNNTGLNYVEGLLKILIEPNVSQNDLARMERSLDRLESEPKSLLTELVRETALFGKELNNLEAKDLLSKILLNHFPDMSKTIFNEMQDRYSLSIELEKMTARLENIKWII